MDGGRRVVCHGRPGRGVAGSAPLPVVAEHGARECDVPGPVVVVPGAARRGRRDRPALLLPQEVQAIIDGCASWDAEAGDWKGNLRDRMVFSVLAETGMFSRGAKRTCDSFSYFGCSEAWRSSADSATGVVERQDRMSSGQRVRAELRWR